MKQNDINRIVSSTSENSLNSDLEELYKVKQELLDLKTKLLQLQQIQENKKVQIDKDILKPSINILSQELINTNVNIKGTITDNVNIAEAFIDNQELQIDVNGYFEIDLYVPRDGKKVNIVASNSKIHKELTNYL